MAKTHIAIVSVPIVSHQIGISEFCKQLLQLHPNFHITFIIPVLESLSNASKSTIATLSALNIDTIVLPPVNFPQETVPTLKVPLAMSQSLPSILDALNSITSTSKVVAVVADYFAFGVLPFTKKLNILSYIYFPSAASVLSLCYHSSILHETISGEFREQKELIQIPGCVPIRGRDLPTSFQDRSSESYKQFLLRSDGIRLADGVFVNSFLEFEETAVKAMMEGNSSGKYKCNYNPSVYMIGPIVKNECDSDRESRNREGSECLAWLDEQIPNSVLYVSFGSGGTLSQNQMNELALGLEKSNQKFLWVVREPSDSPSGVYFKVSSDHAQDPLSFLPEKFLERTKGQGLVVPNWAPQVQILSHKSTGGFLTQCGWFSTLESVVNGLPIIAWPLFAEQRMVAAILEDGLKVAIRPKANESGVVEKGEIAKTIESLMVGDEGLRIRERMKVLQDDAAAAIEVEGSSTTTLSQLVTKWAKNLDPASKISFVRYLAVIGTGNETPFNDREY